MKDFARAYVVASRLGSAAMAGRYHSRATCSASLSLLPRRRHLQTQQQPAQLARATAPAGATRTEQVRTRRLPRRHRFHVGTPPLRADPLSPYRPGTVPPRRSHDLAASPEPETRRQELSSRSADAILLSPSKMISIITSFRYQFPTRPRLTFCVPRPEPPVGGV